MIDFIQEHKGMEIGSYRKSFVLRRLRLRMWAAKATRCEEYLALLKADPEEFHHFLDALGINVTEFFRDPEVFTSVRKSVLPELLERKVCGGRGHIRIWSAACASGDEPYSIAIMMKEELEAGKEHVAVSISATDMDKDALAKARKAEYKANDLRKLDKKTLDKYFIPTYNNLYNLKDEIRRMVNFQEHNLLTDAPLKFMDIIFCRNMMIYLNRQQQEELSKRFHQALNPGGYLVVGKIENIWGSALFSPVGVHDKIYQKI